MDADRAAGPAKLSGMDPSAAVKTALVLLGSYLLGCLATGYYLVRFRAAQDIRQTGSGSSGATNVARLLGWRGFLITLSLDAGKGALAVFLAPHTGLGPYAVWATLIAVVVGHIWPAQLRFRGGKGAGTYLGGLIMIDWRIALMLVPLGICGYALVRQFTLAGLIAIALLPLTLGFLGYPLPVVGGSGALAVLLVLAHRDNIRGWRSQNRLDEGLSSE